MKVLFIGGTGNISSAVSRLCIERGIDLYHLNRGLSGREIGGVKHITADINHEPEVMYALEEYTFDVVVNWIAFTTADIERDVRLFRGKTAQYIFISSASVYQKPLKYPIITESTPLCNPYWQYSRNKIACEDRLRLAHCELGFPITIVRPSLTYDTVIPAAFGGWNDYTIIDRIKRGARIISHGDGTSLWTLTHSEDFARGFFGLIGNMQTIGDCFHITSDELLTWDQIYQSMAAAVGKKANLIHISSDFICHIDPTQTGTLLGDKAISAIFDNTKIKRFVPDFKAQIPFIDGIKRTIAWFEAKPERMKVVQDYNRTIDGIIEAYERAYS